MKNQTLRLSLIAVALGAYSGIANADLSEIVPPEATPPVEPQKPPKPQAQATAIRSASIYGNSAKNFDNGVFPSYEADAQTLTKDINVERNQSGRHNDWQTYNKVIYIRDGSGGGGYHGGGRYNPAAQAERDLRLGAAKIREIQMRLRDDGYYRGRLDGTIGPETRRALRDWQRDNGLQISGYIDSETFAALVN